MAISSEIADGLTELEGDFPATFVWNSTSYTCIASAETRTVDVGEFGLEAEATLQLIVRLGQFGGGATPSERNKITFNSRIYRIEAIEKAPQNAFVIYRCTRSRS